ncbi:CD63 antigen-like [Discoglossus pictus]
MMKKLDTEEHLVFIKAGLFCVILFFWVTGVALICIGAAIQIGLSDVSVILAQTSAGAPVVLTILGMIIFFLSGFGAVGVLKEHHTMVISFSAIMLLLFILEIVVGISAYSYRDELHNNMSWNFLKLLDQYGINPQIAKGLDHMQQQFHCCGAQNYTDWFNSTYGISMSSVPTSCCRNIMKDCGDRPFEHPENIYQEGCVEKLRKWIGDHIGVIGAVGVGMGIAQIFGIMFSCLLVKMLKENYVAV